MIWGIDPGVSGAVVFFDALEGVLEIHDMPILEADDKKEEASFTSTPVKHPKTTPRSSLH